MNICEDGHDPICYESRFCPVCERDEKLAAAEAELAGLRVSLAVELAARKQLEVNADHLAEANRAGLV